MAPESFLQRWSRRKIEQKQPDVEESSTEAEDSAAVAESTKETKPLDEESKVELELPPIDSLGKDSDFTVFMQKGVPKALKQQALRKLWASDPAFGAPDILDIHALDYSHLGQTQEVVQTSYQVGKGFIDKVEEAADAIEAKADRLAGADTPEAEEADSSDGKTAGAGPAAKPDKPAG